VIAFAVAVLATVGAVVGLASVKKSEGKISIVATNFPAYDFVRAVAGDKVEVKMLVKPGVETHDFEPTPQDIIDIKNSKMLVYTGGESDEWIEDVLSDIEAGGVRLFRMMDAVEVVEEEVVEGMEHEHEHEEEDEDGGYEEEVEYDEHVWTSVRNAGKMVNSIRDELAKIMPEERAVFEGNARSYTDKLAEIDQEILGVVEGGARRTVVFGDRFPLRYFVEDYGLEYFAAFPGCAEQTEASSKTIAFLVDKVKAEGIPVVFKIEMSSGKIAETIASEAGARVLTFNSAHNVSAEDFKSGLTYAEIMERNVKVLKEALE